YLEQGLQQGWTVSFDDVWCDARKFDSVVGNQSVSAGNQFERELAFAQPVVAHNKYAQAKDVHEHARDSGCWRKALAQVKAQQLDQLGGFYRGGQKGNALIFAKLKQIVRYIEVAGQQ